MLVGVAVFAGRTAPYTTAPSTSTHNTIIGTIQNHAQPSLKYPTSPFASSGSGLSGVEREIVALAVSLENDCDYCMAAHSTFALMQNADEAAVAAARAGNPPADPKLGAVYECARSLVRKKGHVTLAETQAFLDAGYSPSAAFEVVAQVGHTTLANFAHSISKAPVDSAFAAQEWAATAAV